MSIVPQGSASTTSPRESTSAHAPTSAPDPTLTSHGSQGGQSASNAAGTAELANLKSQLKAGLRQYPDFPSPGILFEDIMPLFADPKLHSALIRAHELLLEQEFKGGKVDVIVGLESRGFLVGPTLAHKLGAGFVAVRKQGKLPGSTVTASYKKEYGEDVFEMQADAIKTGQNVIIMDDIIATGGTAAAAGSLVKQIGGSLLGYVFMMELDFLKGRDKLDAPVLTLLSGQEAKE